MFSFAIIQSSLTFITTINRIIMHLFLGKVTNILNLIKKGLDSKGQVP